MAIYTRFGSKVTIIGVLQDNQNTWLKVQLEDGTTREWAAYEFRADGGWTEIKAAMDALGKPVNVCAFETGLNYGCDQAPAASDITPADYAAAEALGETAENIFGDDTSDITPEAPRAVDYEAIVRTNMLTEMQRDLFPARWETPEAPADEPARTCERCGAYYFADLGHGDLCADCGELDALRAENARLRAALEAIVAMAPRTISQSLNESYAFGYNLALTKTQKIASEALTSDSTQE